MGIVVLAPGANKVTGDLIPVAGEFSGRYLPYLVGDLPVSGGYVHAAWITGNLEADCPALSGALHIGNGPFVEGELPILEDVVGTDSLTGTSNRLALEDELPLLTGELVPGGVMGGELPLWEITLTGIVPSIGVLDADNLPVPEGELFAGASLVANVPGIGGDAEAIVPTTGTVSGLSILPRVSGYFGAQTPFVCSMSGGLPGIASFMGGYQQPLATLGGSVIPAISGTAAGLAESTGTLSGTVIDLDTHNSVFTGDFVPVGNIDGNLSAMVSGSIHDAEEHYYGVLRHIRGEVR
jgi:hypothetical protein